MGDLISFQPRRKPSRARESEAGTAAILFFTGVRYQRMSDPAPTHDGQPSSEDRVGGKRRRKRG
jgi:hypothetical protein